MSKGLEVQRIKGYKSKIFWLRETEGDGGRRRKPRETREIREARELLFFWGGGGNFGNFGCPTPFFPESPNL